MEFIKRHKIQLIAVLVLIVFAILGFFAIKNLIYPDIRKSLYGNRLQGIEEYPVSDSAIQTIKEEITATGKANSVEYNQKGRILNFIIDVKKDVDLVTAESFGDKILAKFEEDEKTYYDFQIFLNCSEDAESELYPRIGYRHKTSIKFVWDREEDKA